MILNLRIFEYCTTQNLTTARNANATRPFLLPTSGPEPARPEGPADSDKIVSRTTSRPMVCNRCARCTVWLLRKLK